MTSHAEFRNAMDMEMAGRMARQDGMPDDGWLRRFDASEGPDDPNRFRSPSWLKADWQHGPLVRAWAHGWSDEDDRIAAGGRPLSPDERVEMDADIRFLSWLLKEIDQGGPRPFVRGDHLSRAYRLGGRADHARFAGEGWRIERKEAVLAAVEAARERSERTLAPHRRDLIEAMRRGDAARSRAGQVSGAA